MEKELVNAARNLILSIEEKDVKSMSIASLVKLTELKELLKEYRWKTVSQD